MAFVSSFLKTTQNSPPSFGPCSKSITIHNSPQEKGQCKRKINLFLHIERRMAVHRDYKEMVKMYVQVRGRRKAE